MGVMLQRDYQSQRLYAHDVVIEKESITSETGNLSSTSPATEDDKLFISSILQRALSVKTNAQESARTNLGYHAGDLGKAEHLNIQGRYRGTGHFGTGTYFVGEEEKVTKDSHYGKRPQHAVDFTDYNLFKVRNDEQGYRLHDFLRIIDGGIKQDWILPALDNQFNIISPTGYYDLAKRKYGEDWTHGDNLLNAMLEYAADNGISVKTLDEYKADEGKGLDDSDAKDYYEEYVKDAVKEEIDSVKENTMQNWGDWIGVFLIIAVLFGGGNGFFGNGNSQAEVAAAINNQSTQTGLRDILLSSANNNYETAMQIAGQNLLNSQQRAADQINVIQGFNAIQQSLAGLSSQLGSCCCDIKSTLLQDKYDAALREIVKLQNDKSNADQSAYLLSVMGKWVANPAATTA